MSDEFDPMNPANRNRQDMAQHAAERERKVGHDPQNSIARDQLRAFVERIERLTEEKKTIADDIKDVYGEAKATGYDPKILRRVIAIRKQDADERAEQEAILDTYLLALGMIERGDE